MKTFLSASSRSSKRSSLAKAAFRATETLEVRRLMSAAFATDSAVADQVLMGPDVATEATAVTPTTSDDHSVDSQSGDAVLAALNAALPMLSLTTPGKYLTGASKADPVKRFQSYLANQAGQLNTTRSAISGAVVTNSYTDELTSVTYIYLQQQYNGVPVLNAVANGAVDAAGRVLTANASFVDIKATGNTKRNPVTPALSAADALTIGAPWLIAFGSTDADLKAANEADGESTTASRSSLNVTTLSTNNDLLQTTTLSAADLQNTDISTSLVFVGAKDGSLELAWHTTLDLPDSSHWWDVALSSSNGTVTFLNDYVEHASYNVFPYPVESPTDGVRAVVTDPADLTASPFGWHDTNGAAGAEYTITRGNNAYAYLDRDANNSPDAFTYDGGSGLTFNPALDLTVAPTTSANQQAALTNLFYLNNKIHDITYRYGFTEAAGNFQTNNYGRGGAGNDAVNAESQDGTSTNNANFATPADGTAPRMQMYLFTYTSPSRDGDLDSVIVTHEYTHGISNRLTGGPANANALTALQSGGMGEGWGDFLGLMLTQKPTDTAGGAYGSGTYVLGQDPTGLGIRRYRYSTNLSIDPLTLGSFNSSTEVHDAGEIWASVLWDLNWAMINRYGPTANIANGYTSAAASGGSALTLRLVLDGMKLQPANPSFLAARDAILQADMALTGGANNLLIWQTFARRGFGQSATTSGASSSTVVQAFDFPSPFPFVTVTQAPNSITPPSFVDITFNESMNPSTFSIASDVLSFTGPTGTNLRPQITTATWSNSNKSLRIGFAPQGTVGTYTLVLSSDIRSADDGMAIDQNLDGAPGTAADNVTVTLTYNPYLGPDAFGYSAGPTVFENLNLVAGAAGVVDTGLSADDATVALNIGANTFNFYGVTYSASSIFVNTNGLITFGAGSTEYSNSNLSGLPSTPAIAALWDDWQTNFDANDAVLYKLEDTTGDAVADRLIIEWSDIRRLSYTSSPATFQAILQLNTGSRPGDIKLNYVDTVAGNVSVDDGASSTVGIKASGSSSPTRLLVTQDALSPYVGSGKAVKIGLDVVAPVVTAATYARRSLTLSIQLSEAIVTPTLSDIVLGRRLTDGSYPAQPYTNFAYNASTRVISLTISGNPKARTGQLTDDIRLTLPSGRLKDLFGNQSITDFVYDFNRQGPDDR